MILYRNTLCIIFVATFSLLICGCTKEGEPQKLVGTVKPSEIKILVGRPGADAAAAFLVGFDRQSIASEDNPADLYLLDVESRESIVMPSKVVKTGEGKLVIWRLDGKSEIGKDWQARQEIALSGGSRSFEAIHEPLFLMYLKTKKGVYEIDTSQYRLFYFLPGNTEEMQGLSITSYADTVKKAFMERGVSLPSP